MVRRYTTIEIAQLFGQVLAAGSTYRIVRASRGARPNTSFRIDGVTAKAQTSIAAGTDALLIKVGQEWLAYGQESTLIRETVRSRKRRFLPSQDQVSAIGTAWLYSEHNGNNIEFWLYGLTEERILLWSTPDEDIPFLANTPPTAYSFSDSVDVPEIGQPKIDTSGKSELGSLLTNQSWTANTTADASHSGSGSFTPSMGTNSTVEVLCGWVASIQAIALSRNGTPSGSDSAAASTGTQWGHSSVRFAAGVTVGDPVSSNAETSGNASGTAVFNLSGTAPLTYQGHLYRENDTLHIVIQYGLKPNPNALRSENNEIITPTTSSIYQTLNSASGVLDGSARDQDISNAIIALHGMLWRRVRHIQFSLSNKAIVSQQDHDVDNLPAKPTELIPSNVWGDEVPNNWQWGGGSAFVDGTNADDRNVPGQLSCLGMNYSTLTMRNSLFSLWGLNPGFQVEVFRSIQKLGDQYYYVDFSAALLENPSLTTTDIKTILTNATNKLAEVTDLVLDSDGAANCIATAYKASSPLDVSEFNSLIGKTAKAARELPKIILANSRPNPDNPNQQHRLDALAILGQSI